MKLTPTVPTGCNGIGNQPPRATGFQSAWSLVLLTIFFATGCGATPPAWFRPNMVKATKEKLSAQREQQVATIMLAMFGTPDDPVALPETGLDEAKLRLAAGPVRSNIVGRKNGLYREHCAHCHGITGDALGPTAAFLNPYPRDYRPGVFKFKSTERADKPTHSDLVRLLKNGAPGTSMPSFALLSETQIEALVEYVKYLSIRGETEFNLMGAFFELEGEEDELPLGRDFLVGEMLTPVTEKWAAAAGARIPVPEMTADLDLVASVAKGRALFYGDKANCVKCHGPTALGDGQANDFDDWNKPIVEWKKEIAGEKDSKFLARAHRVLDGDALKPRTIQPRNLRLGIYRGGRRPLDLYYRIHAGVNGAPMPAAKGTIPPEDIWDIVNYVRSLPYELDGELGADRPMVARDRF